MNITNIATFVNQNTTGASVGYGNLTFDKLLTVNFGVMKSNKDGSLWISWPSRKGKDKDGNDKFFNHIYFPEDALDFKKEIENAILEDFASKLQTSKPEETYAQKKEEAESDTSTPTVEPEKKKLWNKPT